MTEKILAILFVFIKSVVAATGYGGIALLMAIESACIPLPSELIMPFAGYLVFEGSMKLFWVATAGALGCNLGSLVAYEIGCYGGRPLVEKYGRWILMGKRELDWADPGVQVCDGEKARADTREVRAIVTVEVRRHQPLAALPELLHDCR